MPTPSWASSRSVQSIATQMHTHTGAGTRAHAATPLPSSAFDHVPLLPCAALHTAWCNGHARWIALRQGYTEYAGRMRPLPAWISSGAVIGWEGAPAVARHAVALRPSSQLGLPALQALQAPELCSA
jgi:hypothetical protein